MGTHTLKNSAGMEVRVADYGATILSIRVPDREGQLDDVVLGYDTVEEYMAGNPHYFGAVIGRYANRIARGRFSLDEELYWLATNNGQNHLHGGKKGFDKKVWDGQPTKGGSSAVLLRYVSADGEEGYPGTLEVRVRYALMEDNRLVVDYLARTDRATPVNLTQHTYFNLGGATGPDVLEVLDHVVAINADAFTPVDDTLLPTGELRSVRGTPFDFRRPKVLGSRIHAGDRQLRYGSGYDHNFVLNGVEEGQTALVVRVYHPPSGRVLDIRTTEPGLQFYTGNHLDGRGKGGAVYGPWSGMALETQHFPDSPNRPDFPSTILRPGEVFRSRTVFSFGIRDD